jgi:hypothetical protein
MTRFYCNTLVEFYVINGGYFRLTHATAEMQLDDFLGMVEKVWMQSKRFVHAPLLLSKQH